MKINSFSFLLDKKLHNVQPIPFYPPLNATVTLEIIFLQNRTSFKHFYMQLFPKN